MKIIAIDQKSAGLVRERTERRVCRHLESALPLPNEFDSRLLNIDQVVDSSHCVNCIRDLTPNLRRQTDPATLRRHAVEVQDKE